MEPKGLRNYLLMCTGTHLQVGIKHDGVGASVAQGGIGHRALKIHENKGQPALIRKFQV